MNFHDKVKMKTNQTVSPIIMSSRLCECREDSITVSGQLNCAFVEKIDSRATRKKYKSNSNCNYLSLIEVSESSKSNTGSSSKTSKNRASNRSYGDKFTQTRNIILLNLILEGEYPASVYAKMFQSNELRFWLKRISTKHKKLHLIMI